MQTCGQCVFWHEIEGSEGAGQCYGMPPVVMLLPIQAPKQELLALAKGRGPGQAMGLQSMRPALTADSAVCSLFAPVQVN